MQLQSCVLTCASTLLIVAVNELGFEMAKLMVLFSENVVPSTCTSEAEGAVSPETATLGGRANCDGAM